MSKPLLKVESKSYRTLVLLTAIGLISQCFFAYSQSKYVVESTNIITMDNDSILHNHSIIIENGRITEVLPVNSPEGYQDYIRIDGRNKFVLPGLFDMHMHFVSDDRIASDYLEIEAPIPIVFGITGARIMIGKHEHLVLRQKVQKGIILAPKLFIASPQLTAVSFGNRLNGQVVNTYSQAFNAVLDYKRSGYDFIKLTFDLSDTAYQGVIDAAKEVGIPVIGHVSRNVKLEKSLESGQHIEHLDQYLDAILREDTPTQAGLSAFGLFREESWETINFIDSLKLESVIKSTIENDIWNTPTNHFFISSFARKRQDQEIKSSPEWKWFSDEVRDELLSYREVYWKKAADKSLRDKYITTRAYIIRELFRRSGKILAGSDAPEWLNLYGTGLHSELESLVEDVGLTPYEALETATVKPAEFLGLTDHGMIKPGYVADIILLNKNPLVSILHTRDIWAVFTQSKLLERTYLQDMLDDRVKRLRKASLSH